MGELGTMQVKIISRDIIKPSSATPPHLRNYKLSIMDQLSSSNYVPSVLFYSNNINVPLNNISHPLKKSLSETLTLYYPFAGILKDDGVSIDCNDEGVEFLEAQIHCQLSDILNPPKFEAIQLMFPRSLLENNSDEGGHSLVVIQVTHFTCGGIAIGMCMSHKIGDGSTGTTFLNDWATMARQSGELVPSPHFISSSSSTDHPVVVREIKVGKETCVTRRFVFDAPKLAELKAMIISQSSAKKIENPSRTEVVTALLYKCAMAAAASIANSPNSTFKPSILSQSTNMRPKMVPPLAENSTGNFVWYFTISVTDGKDANLHGLVTQLRENRTQFYNKYAKNVTVNDWLLVVPEFFKEANELYEIKSTSSNNVDIYMSSSKCRLPFYKVDFGWGKPIWVSGGGSIVYKNIFSLVDSNKEGGIEAWVSLGEKEMSVFERDEELLSFAELNPSVLDTDLIFAANIMY
ncbi:acyltransferase Pun1-like [Cornus florida]|uniref:acyltransferase Pun1-like n=1 Tax=Cornus florida TaxID=4283 RepID=UPI00289887B0|nr:acyltransferase Pun1-like [Cornus florida]